MAIWMSVASRFRDFRGAESFWLRGEKAPQVRDRTLSRVSAHRDLPRVGKWDWPSKTLVENETRPTFLTLALDFTGGSNGV